MACSSASTDSSTAVVSKFKRATLERAEKFLSDTYFTDVNLRGRIYPDKQPVASIFHYGRTERFQLPASAVDGRDKVNLGDSFGPTWATHWFKVTAVVPERFAGKEVRLRWNSGCEAMVYSMEHEPLQGLTELGGHERTDFTLSRSAVPGTQYELDIEMACNPIFGAGKDGMINAPDPGRHFALGTCELAVFDRDCAALYYDLQLLVDMATHLDDKWPRAYQALYLANDIINCCTVGDVDSYKRCHEMAAQFFGQRNGDSQLTVAAMGNCHIDCAWLWTYDETIRKCGRSFANATCLMEDYPDLTFVCSQAQQYEWVKTHYPAVYQRMQATAKTGQFVPVGGSWVEMDANMPSGESFVRQFLVGQRFFRQEFGHYCDVFWLPDTFGYSGQLPQLMRSAGMRYFLTQKISWNLVNKFPHHSFKWQGIDGTKVLTHFPPAETYGAKVSVAEILKTVTNLQDKGRVAESVMLYGYGDGGGGPTEDMMERLSRLKDCDGLPRLRVCTPGDFFRRMEETSASRLCTWTGEMYLELHNATYTTQAEIKKANRVGEFLLRETELAAAVADLFGLQDYPSEELLRIWKLFLLNQFHDILPGSSIEDAHDLAKEYYKDVHASASGLFNTAFQQLVKNCAANPGAEQSSCRLSVMNPFAWPRQEVCAVGKDVTPPPSATTQLAVTAGDKLVLVQAPACGMSAGAALFVAAQSVASVTEVPEIGGYRLGNDQLQVDVNRLGQLTSAVMRSSGREVFSDGEVGNRLVIFDDVPLFWDAWDVMPYHLETRKVLERVSELKVLDTGPLRVSVQFKLAISQHSSLTQTISLDCNQPYVRFHSVVDWHENRKFLKVEFPVDVVSTDAAYDIQFGHVCRPTHTNTSWDEAKYEVCGHKWCDYSEYGFGVAVMNDCKYGYCARDKVIRLSLLRAPKAPDANSDMGRHEFSYAFFPHHGSFQSASLVQHGYNFNRPLSLVTTPAVAGDFSVSWVTSANPAIVLEAVKKPEEPSGPALVCRFFESHGSHASGDVRFNFPGFSVRSVSSCNILEEVVEGEGSSSLAVSDKSSVALRLGPFQVATLFVCLEKQSSTA